LIVYAFKVKLINIASDDLTELNFNLCAFAWFVINFDESCELER